MADVCFSSQGLCVMRLGNQLENYKEIRFEVPYLSLVASL